MKFSKRFNDTYNFYLRSIGIFDFCGTLNPLFTAIKGGKLSAKECFYFIDSQGINKPCAEPDLLNRLLLTKASVNFQIKEWSQGRADGTLPLIEFSKRQMSITYPHTIIDEDIKVLQWVNNEPVYHKDIESYYQLPEWVITAVENQKGKYYKTNK